MFSFCSDPSVLEGADWFACYLTTGKHFAFYRSFLIVIALILVTAPLALAVGFLAAFARRARFAPLRWLGMLYTSTVRGVPALVFFLFVPIAMDQGLEFMRHTAFCPEVTEPVWSNNEFNVCTEAKLPLGSAPQWVHQFYGFWLAVAAFALVFGAFSALVIEGALRAVPKGQIEAAEAIGMSPGQIMRRVQLPQMWIYALPGLSNLWQVLVKSSPLLFLLGVQDVVYWAQELGGTKTAKFDYPHPDWRIWYFLAILIFYVLLTWVSQIGFERLMKRVSRGMAVGAGG